MTNLIFDHLADIVALILTLWSVVLVWASWQISLMIRSLARERRQLRAWKRISEISSTHNTRWQ